MCDDVPEGLDRASVWCILPKRNMRTPPIIIGGELRKDPPQVLFVEHDQMIGTLAPDRPDQAFNMTVLPGRTERSGPVPNAHRLDAACEYAAEGSVVVADDICWRPVPGECLGNLACQPLRRRMPASIDLFVVPTIAFEQLFAFLILGHGRRQLLWFARTFGAILKADTRANSVAYSKIPCSTEQGIFAKKQGI